MKQIILTATLLTCCTFLFAQEKTTVGFHAGLNISNLTDKVSDVSNPGSGIDGFTGGIDVALPLSGSFFIQPELNYAQAGSDLTSSKAGDGIPETLKMNYLALPVLLKCVFQGTGLGVYAGPQYGYLLNSTVKIQDVSTSANDQFHKSDFAGVVGAEYEFPFHVVLSARYQFGIADIGKTPDNDNTESIKNNIASFTVGYRF